MPLYHKQAMPSISWSLYGKAASRFHQKWVTLWIVWFLFIRLFLMIVKTKSDIISVKNEKGRVSWIFTDPAETISIGSPLLSEFRMVHIIEIDCVQNFHKAVDFLQISLKHSVSRALYFLSSEWCIVLKSVVYRTAKKQWIFNRSKTCGLERFYILDLSGRPCGRPEKI